MGADETNIKLTILTQQLSGQYRATRLEKNLKDLSVVADLVVKQNHVIGWDDSVERKGMEGPDGRHH